MREKERKRAKERKREKEKKEREREGKREKEREREREREREGGRERKRERERERERKREKYINLINHISNLKYARAIGELNPEPSHQQPLDDSGLEDNQKAGKYARFSAIFFNLLGIKNKIWVLIGNKLVGGKTYTRGVNNFLEMRR